MNIELIPSDEICRLCVTNTKSFDFTSRPRETSSDNVMMLPTFFEIIEMFTHCFSSNDGDDNDSSSEYEYPKGICTRCAQKLIDFFEFKIQIEKAQKNFNNLLDEIFRQKNDSEPFGNRIEDLKLESEHLGENNKLETTSRINKSHSFVNIIVDSIEVEHSIHLNPKEQKDWEKKLDYWVYKQSEQKSKRKRRHVCDVCGKSYSARYTLQEHSYVHTGIFNFECTECGRKFGQKKLLNAHMDAIHIKSKFYYCDTCGRQFNRKNNLLAHQRVHSNEGKFKCDSCDRCFKWENSLKAHLLSHSGESSVICLLCGKNFKEQRSLKKHCSSFHDGLGIKI